MKYWCSCEKFTVLVVVDSAGVVTRTVPIVGKFVGQRFETLRRWMEGLGGAIFLRMGEASPPDNARRKKLRVFEDPQ